MITIAIMLLGAGTVAFSIWAAVVFWKQRKSVHGAGVALVSAITFQLFGEATLGLGMLLFSIAEHFGYLATWTVETKSLIRAIILLTACATTAHLLRTINHLRTPK